LIEVAEKASAHYEPVRCGWSKGRDELSRFFALINTLLFSRKRRFNCLNNRGKGLQSGLHQLKTRMILCNQLSCGARVKLVDTPVLEGLVL